MLHQGARLYPALLLFQWKNLMTTCTSIHVLSAWQRSDDSEKTCNSKLLGFISPATLSVLLRWLFGDIWLYNFPLSYKQLTWDNHKSSRETLLGHTPRQVLDWLLKWTEKRSGKITLKILHFYLIVSNENYLFFTSVCDFTDKYPLKGIKISIKMWSNSMNLHIIYMWIYIS